VLFSFGTAASPGRAVLVSNLVDGAFPPYEDVIPKDQDKRVSFDRDTVSSAVKRAALLTNEESRGVRMLFKGKDKQLELTSRAPEMGEAVIKVDLAKYDGDDMEIGFNPQFLTDALKVMNESEVVMELKASNKPGLIKSGTDFMYVVMPVNLQ
jgi:DNA polymerase-3 subunit beta